MAAFPTLTTGSVTQYPSGRRTTFSTRVMRFVDGREQRFRELQQPVRAWLIQMSQLSPDEAAAIEAFFDNNQGQFGSFRFTDPWDGVEYSDCSFDQDTLTIDALGERRYQGHLLIRNNRL